MGINVKHLLDRPCSVCEFHKENGCCKWSCVFEQEPIIDKIKQIVDRPIGNNAEEKAYNYMMIVKDIKEIIDKCKTEDKELTPKNNLAVDCISRADAIRVASGYCHPSNVAKELANLPSVTPQPRKGRWILTDVEGNRIWFCNCSECGKDPQDYISGTENWWLTKSNLPNYCPNCGADMRTSEE